jgi:hypothetical protein
LSSKLLAKKYFGVVLLLLLLLLSLLPLLRLLPLCFELLPDMDPPSARCAAAPAALLLPFLLLLLLLLLLLAGQDGRASPGTKVVSSLQGNSRPVPSSSLYSWYTN